MPLTYPNESIRLHVALPEIASPLIATFRPIPNPRQSPSRHSPTNPDRNHNLSGELAATETSSPQTTPPTFPTTTFLLPTFGTP